MPSVQSAVQSFLVGCEAEGLADSTIRWYRSILHTFSRQHGEMGVGVVTADHIRSYLASLRKHEYSPDTVGDYTRALHRFWKWAAAEYDLRNPMRNIRYPQPPKQKTPRAVDMEDVIRMFKAAEKSYQPRRDQAILAFTLDTGCRAGGICGLKMTDLDMENRKAIVTEKGSKTRSVAFTKFTAVLLLRWMKERDPHPHVFYSLQTLESLKPNGLLILFKRLGKRAGVKGFHNPHSFRHGFAKAYALAGGDLVTLSRIFGDDIKTIVAHYAIFTDQEVSEAHEKYSPISQLQQKMEGEEK